MTDNEIIKVLECCVQYKTTDVRTYKGLPLEVFSQAVLNLINRQKAEIEGLKYNAGLRQKNKKTMRSEAFKEFAERLKERKYQSSDWSHGEHPYVVEEADIDDLVEEMTEG